MEKIKRIALYKITDQDQRCTKDRCFQTPEEISHSQSAEFPCEARKEHVRR